jgi:class 3 adenylate cyclase
MLDRLLKMSPAERDLTLVDQFARLAETLCRQSWIDRNIDRPLRLSLGDCLSGIDAAGLITSFRDERLRLLLPVVSEEMTFEALHAIADRIEELTPPWYEQKMICFDLDCGVVIGTPVIERRTRNDGQLCNVVVGYAALVFRGASAKEVEQTKIVSLHGRPTSALFFQVLQHRVRLFLPFAARVAERYWVDALSSNDPNALLPPWQCKTPLRTVTMSFDLRKSTFCMENADEPSAFARWLDQLVQILERVAHLYGGVFDKFTGDGGLIHFLERECQEIYGKPAMIAALQCAIGLQKATLLHLLRLRRFLRLNSELLGGAIGIDIADAHWSLDHRHNPITVGRGVVNACRIGDKTPANGVRLTNIAYQQLPPCAVERPFVERPFESKEFPDAMKITAWELTAVSSLFVAEEREIEDICAAVYRDDHGAANA